MNALPANETLAKRIRKLDVIAWVFTIVVWLLVGAMRRYKVDTGFDLGFLAGLNALFNTCVSCALIAAFYFINRGRISAHRNSIYVAMALSAGFLLTYILYHFTSPEIPYCKQGLERSIYYFVLLTHIVLAGMSLPFILLTFIRGYAGDYVRHRRMSKWVFPVWLYVAITGPVVYLLLLPCR